MFSTFWNKSNNLTLITLSYLQKLWFKSRVLPTGKELNNEGHFKN